MVISPSAEAMLLSFVSFEQCCVDPALAPAVLAAYSIPAEEQLLVLAAAALAAGEPKRAKRLLQSPLPAGLADLAAVLVNLATVMDLNWCPGDAGAILSVDEAAVLDRAQAANLSPQDVIRYLAGWLVPQLLSLRAVTGTGPGDGDFADQLASRLRSFAGFDPPAPRPRIASLHSLAAADLFFRTGDLWSVQRALNDGVAAAGLDAAAQAYAALVQGDWQAEPRHHPETLGLLLIGKDLPSVVAGPDLLAATDLYARAARGWTLAGSQAGAAAAALRQAHVARKNGDAVSRDALRARAESLALAAGSTALALLAQLHGMIDRISDGDEPDPRWVDRVIAWSASDGSSSYARGFVRVLTARVEAWGLDGEFMRARRGLRLAAALASGIGAVTETTDVIRTLAAQYATVHRPAAIVVADQLLAERYAEMDKRGSVDRRSYLEATAQAFRTSLIADRLASSRMMQVAAGHLRKLLLYGAAAVTSDPALAESSEFRGTNADLEALLACTTPLGELYSGLELRQVGDVTGSDLSLQAALSSARAVGNARVEYEVLLALHRTAEAHGVLERAVASGAVSADTAVSLFVRLGISGGSDAVNARALESLSERWNDPALRWERSATDAELALLRGESANAVWLAEEALRQFGDRQRMLGRDILRSASTDLSEVADVYHTGVLAHLAMADRSRATGDFSGMISHELQSLQIADQARGLALTVIDTVESLTDPDVRIAVRAWLRAGSIWSAAYEKISGQILGGDASLGVDRRVELATIEQDLDLAEVHVGLRAPGLVLDRAPTPVDLAAARAALPEGGLLLVFHAHQDYLVTWALTRSSHRVLRQAVNADELNGLAVRSHGWFSGLHSSDGATSQLVQLLLDPFAKEIAHAKRRLLIAPGPALCLVPFHALPWKQDVLGTRLDVSYLPTVGLLARPDAARQPLRENGALLVGDPTVDPSLGLPRLPGTVVEVRAIAPLLLHPDLLLGDEATEEAIRSRVPGRGILHLAAHGLLQPDAPNLGAIVLAGRDQLSVGDLMGLNLNADLIVLSACHTGEGVATAAGDVVGLTRAALIAGARHVVVSLWPVDDQAAALVMEGMYRGMADGLTISHALAEAQRYLRAMDGAERDDAYRRLAADDLPIAAKTARDGRGFGLPPEKDQHHPYYWAPFIHVGA